MTDQYLQQLKDFKKHLDASVSEMLDIIDEGGEYEERFGIELTVNGKTCKIEMHADAYSRLEGLLEAEMEEFVELTELHKEDK